MHSRVNSSARYSIAWPSISIARPASGVNLLRRLGRLEAETKTGPEALVKDWPVEAETEIRFSLLALIGMDCALEFSIDADVTLLR